MQKVHMQRSTNINKYVNNSRITVPCLAVKIIILQWCSENTIRKMYTSLFSNLFLMTTTSWNIRFRATCMGAGSNLVSVLRSMWILSECNKITDKEQDKNKEGNKSIKTFLTFTKLNIYIFSCRLFVGMCEAAHRHSPSR